MGTSASPGLTLMFVDDEPLLVDGAVRHLESLGHRVEGYTSPLRALERFEAAPGAFDAVLLDRHMRSLDGPELAARIRAQAPAVLLVLFSGFHTDSPDTGHPGALFDAVFDKPVSMAEVSAALVRLHAQRSRP
jgi:CheY-like chemotaxis protein